MFRTLIGMALAVAMADAAAAEPLRVSSYDMPNGDGMAAGGVFNFWDGTYTGAGDRTRDNAPLSRGRGALTDGAVAFLPWPDVTNPAGTGQYVGWNWRVDGVPTIAFRLVEHADQTYTVVDSLSVAVDDSGIGGVAAPMGLLIDGQPFAPVATPISPTAEWLTVSGFALRGQTITLSPIMNPGSGDWVFFSEVTFDGSFMPEPATWAMLILGLLSVGGVARRRRDQRLNSDQLNYS